MNIVTIANVCDYACDRWSTLKVTRLVSKDWKEAVDKFCPHAWYYSVESKWISTMVIRRMIGQVRCIIFSIKRKHTKDKRFDHSDICRSLLQHGHIDMAKEILDDPIFKINIYIVFTRLVSFGYKVTDAVQYLLDRGVDRNVRLAALDDIGRFSMENFQLVYDSLPDLTDKEKISLFTRSITSDYACVEKAEIFLKMGIDPDTTLYYMDGSEATCLYWTLVKEDRESFTKLLINYGADPFKRVSVAKLREYEGVSAGYRETIVFDGLTRYRPNCSGVMQLAMLKMDKDGNDSCIPPMIRHLLGKSGEYRYFGKESFKETIINLLEYGGSFAKEERDIIKRAIDSNFHSTILAELDIHIKEPDDD